MGSVVYSTTTNDTLYVEYLPVVEGGQARQIRKQVLVKGGSNLATKQLITPIGVATHVTDSDAEFLEQNEAFKRHKSRGFVQIRKENVDPEKVVAAGMEVKDKSAPRVPQDYPDSNDEKVAKPADTNSKGILSKLTSKWI